MPYFGYVLGIIVIGTFATLTHIWSKDSVGDEQEFWWASSFVLKMLAVTATVLLTANIVLR